jgi:hypothetical protein
VEAQKRKVGFLWKFYIDANDAYRDTESWHSTALRWCTVLAGIFFFGAVFCTAIFATNNISRYSKMPEHVKSSKELIQEGRNTMATTPVPQITAPVKQDQATGASQSNATTAPCEPGAAATSNPQSKP